MSLFQSQYGGQGVVTPYQFQPSMGLPDISMLVTDRSAQSQRSSGGKQEKDYKDIVGLHGAVREFHQDMAEIDSLEQETVAKYRDIWENQYGGPAGSHAFMADYMSSFTQEMAQIGRARKDVEASLSTMKADFEAWSEMRKDPDVMNNLLIQTTVGGTVQGFGLRNDGTVGWGIMGLDQGVSDETILRPMTGSEAFQYINQTGSRHGTDIPLGYSAKEARDTYRQMALDVNKMFTEFVAENQFSLKDNLKNLHGLFEKVSSDIPQHLRPALYNEALKGATPVFDDEGNFLDLTMPAYGIGVEHPNVNINNIGELVQARPYLIESEETFSVLANVDLAISNTAKRIGGATALGMQNISVRRDEPKGLSADDTKVERGFFSELEQVTFPMFDLPSIIMSGEPVNMNYARQLNLWGNNANLSELQSELDNISYQFYKSNNLAEDLIIDGENYKGRPYHEVGAVIERMGNAAAIEAIQNGQLVATHDEAEQIQTWWRFLSPELQEVYGNIQREKFEYTRDKTRDAHDNSEFKIYAQSTKTRWYSGLLSAFNLGKPKMNVDVSFLRPDELKVNATAVPNWKIQVYPASTDHVIDHQRIIGGTINAVTHGDIRIAGTEIRNVGDITNKPVPFIQSNEFYTPMYFTRQNGAREEFLPSTKGYLILHKDDIANIKVNQLDGKPVEILKAFDGYAEKFDNAASVIAHLEGVSLDDNMKRMLLAGFTTYSHGRGSNDDYYKIPVLHVISDPLRFDLDYDWIKDSNVSRTQKIQKQLRNIEEHKVFNENQRARALQQEVE